MKGQLNRGIIISCQAAEGEPLYGLGLMKHFAIAAVEGGAVGIRCLSAELEQIKNAVTVPIIGLQKKIYSDSSVYITPTIREVKELIGLHPTVIALDATSRPRPNGECLEDLVSYIREHASEIAIMADIATEQEAKRANQLGFDYISTTMRGYTEETQTNFIPDFDFIKRLKQQYADKLVVEGGIWEKWQLEKIIEESAPYAVVIGTAVTRPRDITRRFSNLMRD